MTVLWWETPWTVIDFETTGTDVETDRAVQVAAVEILPGAGVQNQMCTVIDPGVDIPDAAAAIHGITTGRARAEGADPARVIPAVAQLAEIAWAEGTPVVAMNAAFDLTLLDRELRRHAGRGLDMAGALVLDPYVIDRACDPYRAGKRTLGDLAAHYKVRQDGAHDAAGDCLTAARVLWRQRQITAREAPGSYGRLRKMNYAPLRDMTLAELQGWQARQHAARQADFQRYLREKAKPPQPTAVVDGSWPWRPAPAPAEAGT